MQVAIEQNCHGVELTAKSAATRNSRTAPRPNRRATTPWSLARPNRQFSRLKLSVSGFDAGELTPIKVMVLVEQTEVAAFHKEIESSQFPIRKIALRPSIAVLESKQ